MEDDSVITLVHYEIAKEQLRQMIQMQMDTIREISDEMVINATMNNDEYTKDIIKRFMNITELTANSMYLSILCSVWGNPTWRHITFDFEHVLQKVLITGRDEFPVSTDAVFVPLLRQLGHRNMLYTFEFSNLGIMKKSFSSEFKRFVCPSMQDRVLR